MNSLIIFIISFILGVFSDFLIGHSAKRRNKKLVIGNVRVHHVSLSLVCFVLSLFFYAIQLIGFGMGFIIGHTIREKRFVFFELR